MKKLSYLVFAFLFATQQAWAYWVWSPEEGKFVNVEGVAQDEAEEQYQYAMDFYKDENNEEVIKQLQDLLEKHPSSRIAPEAQYRLGTIYEEESEYLKAFDTYKDLVNTYPQSERINEVVEREFRIGNLFLSGRKGKLMGIEILPSLPRAIEVFKHIVDQAPYSDYGDKSQFRLGIAYQKSGRFQDAINAFQGLLDQYPQSSLVPDARFQMAETSFKRSAYQFRDQRALEDATTKIDQFLTRHPEGQASEQAAKLRQQIDEKNAEKNYRIGLYYEKTKYVRSALIYYQDVARRYPNTLWGKKSAQKLEALKSPATFHQQQVSKIQSEKQQLETKLANWSGSNNAEKERLERQLDRIKNKEKMLDKDKLETLKSRREDLKRRESELKEKYKKLKKKKKLLEKNQSEDLRKALERWELSLNQEKAMLQDEKARITDWHHTLGEKMAVNPLEMLPFVGEEGPTTVKDVREIEAKDFYKISSQKRDLLTEKETLYKQHGEVLLRLKGMEGQLIGLKEAEESISLTHEQGENKLRSEEQVLAALKSDISILEKEIKSKKDVYDGNYEGGFSRMMKAPAHMAAKSLSFINPFDGKKESLEDLSLDQLLERRMHLKEKVAAQKGLVDTLSQAFDSEMAYQERKRLLNRLQDADKADPRVLRKEVRKTEKAIRSRYDEIQDRHKKKEQLLEELDSMIQQGEKERGAVGSFFGTLAKPAVGFARLSKDFIAGSTPKDVKLTEGVTRARLSPSQSARAIQIKEILEEESLIIEARTFEIEKLEKELDVLKAKASLSGGYKFRSAMVKLPYSFLKDAVESAQRLVPKKNRQEMLIQLLDKESLELENLKRDYQLVSQAVDRETGVSRVSPLDKRESPEKGSVGKSEAQQEQLRSEILALTQKLESQKANYAKEKMIFETQEKLMRRELNHKEYEELWKKRNKELSKEEKKLVHELKEIEQSLQKIILEETELEQKEELILSKRIKVIDDQLLKPTTPAISEDLVTEKDRMEARLSQIETRQSFLSKELEKFEVARRF